MWFGPGRSICPPRLRACRGIKSGRMGGLIDLALIAASTCFNICYNMLQHAMLQPTRRYVRSRYVCTWLYVIYCNWMGLSIWIGIWNGSKIITIALGSNLPRNFNPRAHIETDGDSMGDSRLAPCFSSPGCKLWTANDVHRIAYLLRCVWFIWLLN
jgi:hypothetical protein